MKLIDWIKDNVRIFHKTKNIPTIDSLRGIYFIWNSTNKGIYIVSGTPTKKVYEIYDWSNTNEEINTAVRNAVEIIDESLAEVNTRIIYLQDNKVDRSELANLGVGIKRYESDVEAVDDLPLTSNTEGDARVVINDIDVNGRSFIWLWDGTQWKRTPFTTFPSTIVVEGQLIASIVNIDLNRSATISTNISNGLKAFRVFRLVLYNDYKNNDYFIFGLYNWKLSDGVPLFKIGKMVGSVRTQVTPNTLSANNTNLQYIQSNNVYRLFLNDGAGYIEFSIDIELFGGYNPVNNITYLSENENKKLYIRPSNIEVIGSKYKRAFLETYRRAYYDYLGNRTVGDHASQKSAIYPINGNRKNIKITTTLSGDVPALVFFDKNMNFIEYYKDGLVYDNYVIPFYKTSANFLHAISKAAFVAINGQVGYEQSLWIEDTEQTEFSIEQLNVPVSAYVDAAYMNSSGNIITNDVANMCYLRLRVTQKDVIAISSYLIAPGAPLAVYKDISGATLDSEGGLTRREHNLYYLTIPKDAVEVYINGQISLDRLKVFINGRVSDYLKAQLTEYNKQNIIRTVSSYYDINSQLVTGHPAQSATKIRCFQNEEFSIDTITSGIVPLLIVTDISGNVIEYKELPISNEQRSFKEYLYKIPSNGFWLMVNGTTNNPLIIKRKNIESMASMDEETDMLYYWISGKRVLVLGNSIPAGSGYHEAAWSTFNITGINQALGASFVKRGEQSPTTPILANNSNRHRMSSLIETQAEKAAIWSGLCTPDQLAWAKTTSYEVKVLPYLSGVNKVDLVIIEHGFNDRLALGTLTDLQNRNKDTFVGAMAALIDIIRNIDYRMRIMIQAHYDNTMTAFFAKEICEAQELVANYMGVPVFKFYEKTGLSNQWIADTSTLHGLTPEQKYSPSPTGDLTQIQCMMPDGVHPFSDPTGLTSKIFADIEIIKYKEIR